MKQKIRTFVAVEIDSAVRGAAEDLIRDLAQVPVEVKWVEPENLHVTIKFLGDVDSREVHRVCQAVEKAVAGLEPFRFELRGAGAFPSLSRPRTLWLGPGEGAEEMATLAARVEKAVEKLGFRREARRFKAHLTIGRVRRPTPALAQLSDRLREHADFEAGRTHVRQVVVFSSQLDRSGPTYQALARAPLAGAQDR